MGWVGLNDDNAAGWLSEFTHDPEGSCPAAASTAALHGWFPVHEDLMRMLADGGDYAQLRMGPLASSASGAALWIAVRAR